ncbi:MAG: cytidylate kinase family protein, partial [Clostridia bacterium]|nr:cytidylate kinase family protein [Clostridia bacterium]
MASKIITIARQYGSGGREIGRNLAEQCGFDFYDNNLIALSAKKIG